MKKLDNGFRRLTWARNQSSPSLLKRFLTKPIFQQLKLRLTIQRTSLLDVAKAGFEHLDSQIGLIAPDIDSYEVFLLILHPAICTIHQGKHFCAQCGNFMTFPSHRFYVKSSWENLKLPFLPFLGL